MRQHLSIRTVRIEIEPDKVVQGRGWIQQAIPNGFQVVATYHKCAVLGSDDVRVNELSLAAAWWVQNYSQSLLLTTAQSLPFAPSNGRYRHTWMGAGNVHGEGAARRGGGRTFYA